MAKVWLVHGGDSPSDHWIAGLFSSREKAIAWLEGQDCKHVLRSDGDWWRNGSTRWSSNWYNIEEHELDAPVDDADA